MGLAPCRQGVATRGMAGEQQAYPAPLARRGPQGPVSQAQEAHARHRGTRRPMSLIAPNALWALDFQFDTTEDTRTLKLLEHCRRVHPGVPGHRGRTLHRRRSRRGDSRPPRRRTRRSGLRALRQWSRVHRSRRRRLVPFQRRRLALHRSRFAVVNRPILPQRGAETSN